MPHPTTDWVAVAKRAPVLDIGQISPTDRRALDAAVRRGELVRGRARFFGRMAEKACYAASHDAIAVMVENDQRAFDIGRAKDSFNDAFGARAA